MRVLWYLVGNLREAWGNFGRKLGKNYLILKRLVGETFMNQWKNIYTCVRFGWNGWFGWSDLIVRAI